MNKELEKAIKKLKRRNQVLKLKYAITNEDLKAIETVLQALENSISKEVIEEKIKKVNEKIKQFEKDSKGCTSKVEARIISDEIYTSRRIKDCLQELMEGK